MDSINKSYLAVFGSCRTTSYFIKHKNNSARGFTQNLLVFCMILLLNLIFCDCVRENVLSKIEIIDVSMPGVRPTQEDHYLCTAKNIESYDTSYIQAYEPNSNADRAHHMLLFSCDDMEEDLAKKEWWDCGHHYNACRNMRIIYAWAKNADPTVMPRDVAFRIGRESNIKNLVLQVHYAHPLPEGTEDRSGFRVSISHDEPKYLAGILLMFRSYLEIPPMMEKIHGDMNCDLSTPAPIHPFAYRVHTHKLGVVVSGYKIDQTNGLFKQIGKGNPQWPQAFYPIKNNITINPKDYIAARCTFSTVDFDKTTRIGQTAGDEMCNLYIMFYTASRDPEDHYITCGDEMYPEITKHLPDDSDIPLPRNITLEEHAKGHHSTSAGKPLVSDNPNKSHAKKRPGASRVPDQTLDNGDYMEDGQVIENENRLDAARELPASDYKVVSNWPDPSVKLGQASGVDFDTSGNVVVFHRGDRVWGFDSFDTHNVYRQQNLGPINTDTVLIIHPTTGKILHAWGKDMFYMPHDITVDGMGNFWLTDVALHQVFKFEPSSTNPSMVLGTKFEPGNDDHHFCKPAAVAVMSNGDFFVADGYCNSRIIKFNSRGETILQWGRAFQPNLFTSIQSLFNRSPPPYAFQIPHALALAEDKNLLCVADRENGRIQCFHTSNGTFEYMIESPKFGGRLFSVAYSSNDGGYLYAVNGPNSRATVQGFVIPMKSRRINSVFKPETGFGNPHDIAVTKNGLDLYVVEITKPYKVWKFSKESSHRQGKGENLETNVPVQIDNHVNVVGPMEPIQQTSSQSQLTNHVVLNKKKESLPDESFGASVIIMAFLTIPLLLLIGVGALMRLRSSGWCRSKETKSFAEFFPPSAGFEKLKMDESDSDNSDTEVEEFTVSSYRKSSA